MKSLKTVQLIFILVTTLILAGCKQETNTTINIMNSTININNPSITWDAVSAKDVQYRIQISDTKDFKRILDEARGLKVNEYKIPEGKLPNGNYYFRICEEGGSDIGEAKPVNLKIDIKKPEISSTGGDLPKEGLIAYYPFNGNANDESGNGKNGVVKGTSEFVSGFNNLSLKVTSNLDETKGGYVELPNFHFKSMNTFSYSFWIKEESLLGAESYISFRDDLTPTSFTSVGIERYGRKIIFRVEDKSKGGIECDFLPEYENHFVHYCLVYENGIMKAYINGLNKGHKSENANIDGYYSYIAKHLWSGFSSTRFSGLIDELRIYNRALNDTEILSLYNEGGKN